MTMRKRQAHDVAVIGGGIAGLTAAWHAAQAGLSVVLVEASPLFGGQVATLDRVDGFPFIAPVSGHGLAASLLEATVQAGVTLVEADVIAIEQEGALRRVVTEAGAHRCRAVVVASGCRRRLLNVPHEASWAGRGLSHCVACDGGFYRGRDVMVVGGGDAAFQAAAALADICREVAVVVRGNARARRSLVDRATGKANLRFIWGMEVDALLGDDGLSGVRLRDCSSGRLEEVACRGVFPLIGGIPNSAFLPMDVARTDTGHVCADDGFATTSPGIWAIGAVRDGYCGELAAAAGEAAAVIKAIAPRFRD